MGAWVTNSTHDKREPPPTNLGHLVVFNRHSSPLCLFSSLSLSLRQLSSIACRVVVIINNVYLLSLAACFANLSRLFPKLLVFFLQKLKARTRALELQLQAHLLARDCSFVSLKSLLGFFKRLQSKFSL